MNEGELVKWSKSLLMKIHVITGWTIPASPELTNILMDQFRKTLAEKYPELNPDEIEYAFRQHGTSTEDWGKALNLNLIDGVLIPYVNSRFELSEIESHVKRHKDTPPQRIFTQAELDDSAREDAERQYQSFLRGIELKGLSINKAILEKDGLLKEGESVMDFFKRKASALQTNIYKRSV